MRRLIRAGATAVLVAGLGFGVPAASAVAPRTGTAAVQAAVKYGTAHGMTNGVAVIDTRSGKVWAAGRARTGFMSASVVKVLIATRLLLAGKMHGATATSARKMITRSDNDAAYALYPKAGGAGLVPWLARHYKIPGLGAPAVVKGIWGTTLLKPLGLAHLYRAVRRDPKVWPWLGKAMHAYEQRTSTGEFNAFGVAQAAPSAAVKNGWAIHARPHSAEHAFINTTGFVGRDRYAVIILSRGAVSMYAARGEAVVTHEARILLPVGTWQDLRT
jgi:hypothetical protein